MLPKQIVVYSHYASSVYFDGVLKHRYGSGSSSVEGWGTLCHLLGIKYEFRHVQWEDWPGARKDSAAVYVSPPLLKTLEAHFEALTEQRKVERIEMLRRELKTLTGEA